MSDSGQTKSDRDPQVPQAIADMLQHGATTYRIGIVMGISAGTLFCVAGFVLMFLGLTGTIEWVIETADLTSRLLNASPGVVLALMGMIIVWRYKPIIKDEFNVDRQPTRDKEKDERRLSGLSADIASLIDDASDKGRLLVDEALHKIERDSMNDGDSIQYKGSR